MRRYSFPLLDTQWYDRRTPGLSASNFALGVFIEHGGKEVLFFELTIFGVLMQRIGPREDAAARRDHIQLEGWTN